MTQQDEVTDARRANRVLAEVVRDADTPVTVDPAPDRTRLFSSLNFSRMRTSWNPGEQEVIDAAKSQADRELGRDFNDLYRILHKVYEIVRTPVRDRDTGQPVTDRHGLIVWETDHLGMVLEDWSRLTERDKDGLIHEITTHLVMWEQKAADFWAEAMFAKALWEEHFAITFVETPLVENRRPTVEDRTQNAQVAAREQRYLAIYMSVRSKKAEALVRSMALLSQRLKDTSA
jgi:hypothetical protein